MRPFCTATTGTFAGPSSVANCCGVGRMLLGLLACFALAPLAAVCAFFVCVVCAAWVGLGAGVAPPVGVLAETGKAVGSTELCTTCAPLSGGLPSTMPVSVAITDGG